MCRFPYSTPPQSHRARGFTLIELMIVVLVLAIMIGMAAPAFRNLVLSQRIKTASFDVFSTLVAARSEAITRNATIWICSNGGTEWNSGWTIRTTDCAGSTIRSQDAYSTLTITGPASLSYNGMGRLAGGAATTINLTATSLPTDMVATSSRCISVDISGRPVSKTGTCS